MTNIERPLRVFLCHASGDKPAVKKLYQRLVSDGVDAWLDKEKLIPGQNWQIEIPKAVKNSDVVIVFLSSQSVTKEGYVQKEIRFALDAADEKPDGTIFIIPARLEDCDVPERLSRFHWVDLFSSKGYEWLLKALQTRADNVGAIIKYISKNTEKPTAQNTDSEIKLKSRSLIPYLSLVDAVFADNEFEPTDFPQTDKAFYKRETIALTVSEIYFVFKYVSETLSPDDIQSFSQEIFEETVRRKKTWQLFCYPTIIADSISKSMKEFIKAYNPKHSSKFEFPVIVELSSGKLYYYTGTPLWGFGMYSGIRSKVELLLGQFRI